MSWQRVAADKNESGRFRVGLTCDTTATPKGPTLHKVSYKMQGLEVTPPPGDTVSSVVFQPTDNVLLCGAWDKTVSAYDCTEEIALRGTVALPSVPLDTISLAHGAGTVVGDAAGRIWLLDGDLNPTALGSHDAGVPRVRELPEAGCIASVSWDASLRLWDPRNPERLVGETRLPQKAFAADVARHKIVVGLGRRAVHIYDARKLAVPWQKRESSLKHALRDVACTPDGQGYVCASVEGRVGVEFFDPAPESQAKKYAFKCHRRPAADGLADEIFPVNALAFHPAHGTLCTAGSDGVVNVWDMAAKKRLHKMPAQRAGITAMAFGAAGRLFATASGYNWEHGAPAAPPPPAALLVWRLGAKDFCGRQK